MPLHPKGVMGLSRSDVHAANFHSIYAGKKLGGLYRVDAGGVCSALSQTKALIFENTAFVLHMSGSNAVQIGHLRVLSGDIRKNSPALEKVNAKRPIVFDLSDSDGNIVDQLDVSVGFKPHQNSYEFDDRYAADKVAVRVLRLRSLSGLRA